MNSDLLYALQIMGLGMAGIFVVMAVIWIAISVLGRVFREEPKDKQK